MKKFYLFLVAFIFCTTTLFSQTTSLNEGFEGATCPPIDWTVINNSTTNTIGCSSVMSHNNSGNSFCFSSYSSASDYNQYLITPELTLSNQMDLSFYYANSYSYNETFEVGYSTTDSLITSFTFSSPVNTSSMTWAEYTASIPATAKYICIHYSSNYMYYLYIDDFVLQDPPVSFPFLSASPF